MDYRCGMSDPSSSLLAERQAPAPVQFYFDFSSPYSYIASEWVDAVAARHGRRVQWHAVLLGALFRTTGLKPLVEYPVKREYSLRDIERSACFAGVPFKLPPVFPIATQNAARVFWWLAASDHARAVAWARACLRAYFARGIAIDSPAALRGLAEECGLDVAAAEAAWADPVWKDRLREVNELALAAGVFGAPYFVVDGEPFWGNDRQAQIESWLANGPPKGLSS